MMLSQKKYLLLFILIAIGQALHAQRQKSDIDFDSDWRFRLIDTPGIELPGFNDSQWRRLTLPHDWSIEGQFSKDNPATPEGGALPGGIGWYRKLFSIPAIDKDKEVFIDFDGVYYKSTVWINGHQLGFRPNGYISFRYDITPYLKFGTEKNVIAVKVDNSTQPNSRWYSGSGIYRNVWLIKANKVAIDHWGTYVTTPKVSAKSATIDLETKIRNYTGQTRQFEVVTSIQDQNGLEIATAPKKIVNASDSLSVIAQVLNVSKPNLWSIERPYLYQVITRVRWNGKTVDTYRTPLGIRYFEFDADKGFSLNGKAMKILGVCDHHDLGSLGSAFNYRALERQLQILKAMGCNAIRTSHNPPAPELLELTDKMGFIVMDEAFDCWEDPKVKFDYHLYFKDWHKKDLEDQLLRDRDHPSVFIWSIGNEIHEQSNPKGFRIAKDLAAIVRSLDQTRPISSANNDPSLKNQIVASGSVDLVGYNYHYKDFASFQQRYPGKKFIATETTSALATRGYYDLPADSNNIAPRSNVAHVIRRDGEGAHDTKPNEDYTISAYDQVAPPWGSTHEEAWKEIKKYAFLSGMFIWTGFDYLGEPTPYTWPARSSYFGIVDLAGFPKDSYYMYRSEWTDKPVLHIFPHWNWEPGKTVDVWAYYNQADEVELYLNGQSMGIRKKSGDDLHVSWRLKYIPGTLKAVSRKNGKVVLTQEIHTAGLAAKIELIADRDHITADHKDLSFITARILDKDGNLVPDADNDLYFKINGEAAIVGVDNGNQVSHVSLKGDHMPAFHGLALAIIQAGDQEGTVAVTASSAKLPSTTINIELKK